MGRRKRKPAIKMSKWRNESRAWSLPASPHCPITFGMRGQGTMPWGDLNPVVASGWGAAQMSLCPIRWLHLLQIRGKSSPSTSWVSLAATKPKLLHSRVQENEPQKLRVLQKELVWIPITFLQSLLLQEMKVAVEHLLGEQITGGCSGASSR